MKDKHPWTTAWIVAPLESLHRGAKLSLEKELKEFLRKQILPPDLPPLQKLRCTEILKVTKSF